MLCQLDPVDGGREALALARAQRALQALRALHDQSRQPQHHDPRHKQQQQHEQQQHEQHLPQQLR